MTNYYVSKSGNNGSAGTSTGTAWLTLAYAYAQLTPGDTLFIRGGANYGAREIWNEAVTLTTAAHDSGTSGNRITIRNYPGEYIELKNNSGTPFYINGALDYWGIVGTKADGTDGYADEANKDDSDSAYYIDINCNQKTSSGYGLRIRGANYFKRNYVNVRNGKYFCLCMFDDADYPDLAYCRVGGNFIGPGSDAAGDQFQSDSTDNFGGTTAYTYYYDCGSDGVVLDLPGDGLSTTLWTGLTVSRCTFTAWVTAGKSENGVDFKASDDGVIEYCHFTGFTFNDGLVSASGSNSSSAIVIHSYSTSGNIVRWNTFTNCSGRAVDMKAPGSVVHHNLVYGFTDEAATSSGNRNFFYFASSGGTTHEFYNNTCVEKHGGSGTGQYIRILSGVTVTGKNNIFYDCEDVDIAGTFTHSYSCYYSCTQTPSGGSNNITTDPAFYNAGANDYRLSSTSPCINAGTAIAGITDGYYGAAPDMGYYERGTPESASDTLPGTSLTGQALNSFTVTALQFDGTTAADFTGTITISKESGAGTLSGTLAVAAVAGVATFSNVVITGAGDTVLQATVTV